MAEIKIPSRDASTDGTAIKVPDNPDSIGNYSGEIPFSRRGRLYGRKWQILIYKPAYKDEETTNADGTKTTKKVRDPEHDTAMDVSLLKCIFKVKYNIDTPANLCTLVVYNMNAATEKEVIEEGFQISISAGYQEGQYGQIYTGDIVQVFRNRENGVDYRLEIVALSGLSDLYSNHIRSTMAAGSTPRKQIEQMSVSARKAIVVGDVPDALDEQPLPRGKVLFGTPAKYLRDIAIWNDANFWEGQDGRLTVEQVEQEIPEDRCLVLTPKTGLVGTPAYTDNGINIKMLLDPRVVLRSLIKIDNEIIQRQAVRIDGNGQQSSNTLPQTQQFDKDGEYQVFQIEHSGDTWGDDWTTTVVAASRTGRMGKLNAVTDKQTMK